MCNLDVINDAISKNKKISFIYNSYDEKLKLRPRRKEIYIVSPYQMAATNGRYYLICNTDNHDNISHYRIDKMTEINMLKIPSRPKKQIKEFLGGNFNLPKHMAEHIYMFSGESIWVKFWAENFMIDALVDWFGKDFKILQKDDDRLLINVKVNKTAMKFWAMQYGEYVEILKPVELRNEIRVCVHSRFINV